MAGLDLSGFTKLRLQDIKTELETTFRTIFGSIIDVSDSSPFGQLIGVLAERASNSDEYVSLQELVEATGYRERTINNDVLSHMNNFLLETTNWKVVGNKNTGWKLVNRQ